MPEATTQNIGPYRLVRMLAQGGMAEIWLAQHPEHGECVVKRVHPHLVSNTEFLMMFVDEARIAARLNHPGCVEIFDLGKEGETYYIAMEYIDGEDIRKIARQARHAQIPLPRKLAVAILMGACDGLHYAHEVKDSAGRPLNVVHRDVSPQNILVTFEGKVRIVDFGIAKAADQANRTRSGVLKGKYAYMAPEQILGVPIDRRADVFALGILLYELTTGRRLFKAKTELETMRRITQNIFIAPAAASPGYPPALETIVLKAISNDRIGRYASALEFKEALGDFLEAHRVAVTPADLAAFMKQVFSERLQAIDQAQAGGNTGALLDARFGEESSESSGEGLAPDDASLSGSTAESTAIDDEPLPVSAGDLPDVRTDRAPPVPPGPSAPPPGAASTRSAFPSVRTGAPIEAAMAPTQASPAVPELLARSTPDSGLKITETAMPAVHFDLPPAAGARPFDEDAPTVTPETSGSAPAPEDVAVERAKKPTAASMAAVWVPPETGNQREKPHRVAVTRGDARLMSTDETGYDPTTTEPHREQDEKTWYNAPVSDEVSSSFDEAVPAHGGALFLWVIGGVAVAAAAFVGALLLSRNTAPDPKVLAVQPIALQKSAAPEAKPDIAPRALPPPKKTPTPEPTKAPSRALPARGKLTLKTTRGARGVVFVDGKRVGKLPLAGLSLSPGRHRVEIRRGKRKQRLQVQITAGQTTVKALGHKRKRRRR